MATRSDHIPLPALDEGVEIEFKWLLDRSPDLTEPLLAEAEIWQIEQLYLCKRPEGRPRLRRVRQAGAERFYLTVKEEISPLVRIERESQISEEQWRALRAERDPKRAAIEKNRYRFRYDGRLWELDHLHAPVELWLLEVEVEAADQRPTPPTFLGSLRDVSEDPAYRNAQIAKRAAAR